MKRIHPIDTCETVTLNPVKYTDEEFYHYPDNPIVGVSKDGRILDTRNNKLIRISSYYDKRNTKGKRYVVSVPYFIDGKWIRKTIGYARVICRTFVGRPLCHANIPFSKLEVNHINLDSADNHFNNLEWCVSIENVNHSFDNDNSVQQLAVVAKNIVTNEEMSFRSVTKTSTYFNICGATLSALLKKYSGELRNGSWIFKYKNDTREWRSPTYRIDVEKISRAIDIKNIKTGEIITFSILEAASKYLRINYFTLAKAVREKEINKYRYGEWMIKEHKDTNWPTVSMKSLEIGSIKARAMSIKSLDTNKITEFGTFTSCYEYLNITESRMRAYISNGNYLKFRLGNYIIKPESDKNWPDLNIESPDYPVNSCVKTEIRNIHSGDISVFDSITIAANTLNIKPATLGNALRNRLNYKYLYGDYVVRLSDQQWPTLRLGAPTIRIANIAKEVKVHDTAKKHITLFPTISSACKFLDVDKNRIIRGLKNADSMKLNQYIVSYI